MWIYVKRSLELAKYIHSSSTVFKNTNYQYIEYVTFIQESWLDTGGA